MEVLLGLGDNIEARAGAGADVDSRAICCGKAAVDIN